MYKYISINKYKLKNNNEQKIVKKPTNRYMVDSVFNILMKLV